MAHEQEIPDYMEAHPQHCCAVLNAEAKEFQDKINFLFNDFIERTGLRLTCISFTTMPDCGGNEIFTGLKIQFGI